MAVHSVIGFGGSMFGPLISAASSTSPAISRPSAGVAYAHLGLVVMFGPLVLRWLKPSAIPGDRN